MASEKFVHKFTVELTLSKKLDYEQALRICESALEGVMGYVDQAVVIQMNRYIQIGAERYGMNNYLETQESFPGEKRVDAEIAALIKIVEILKPFPQKARERMIGYIVDLVDAGHVEKDQS